jgi:hypothetical protein
MSLNKYRLPKVHDFFVTCRQEADKHLCLAPATGSLPGGLRYVDDALLLS